MRLVIDVEFLTAGFLPVSSTLLKEVLIEMMICHPDDSFVLLATAAVNVFSDLPANVSIRIIKSNLLKVLGRRWWYKHMLPKELKNLKADIYLSIENLLARSNPIPCCLLLPGMDSVEQTAQAGKKNRLVRLRMAAAMNFASILIATSEYDKQQMQNRYGIPPEKIKLWRLPVNNNSIKALKWTEKESVKTQYAGGRDYFVFAGDIDERHRLLDLLQAFSQFKKWQQSNMQLLITGSKTIWTNNLMEKMLTYKYRNDVLLIPDPSDKTFNNIISGAYAFVYPAIYDYFPFIVLLAMKAQVPVITSGIPLIREVAGNAALYAKPDSTEGFANSMQVLYKDEQYRNELIKRAEKHIEQREQTLNANDCWNILMQLLPANS